MKDLSSLLIRSLPSCRLSHCERASRAARAVVSQLLQPWYFLCAGRASEPAVEPGGVLQLSGPALVKRSQQVLSICLGPRVTLANLLSPAVASADGGKADGEEEISEAGVIEAWPSGTSRPRTHGYWVLTVPPNP